MLEEPIPRLFALRGIGLREGEGLIRAEPSEAAQYVSETTSLSDVGRVATRYAEKDPAAALAWARSLPRAEQRNRALAHVAGALLKTDLAQARAVMDELPQNLQRQQLEATYIGSLAKSDVEAALELAKEKLQGVLRLEALARVAVEVSAKDPLRALQMWRDHSLGMLAHLGAGSVDIRTPDLISYGGGISEAFLARIMREVAAVDPRLILQTLQQDGLTMKDSTWDLPGLGFYATQMMEIFGQWMKDDAGAAGRWLSQQPSQTVETRQIEGVVGAWFAQDGADLLEYVARLPEGDMRLTWVEKTAKFLRCRDAHEALTWAQGVAGEAGLGAAFQVLAQTDPLTAAQFYNELPPAQ